MKTSRIESSGFGGYESLERIDHGGMGWVYRAWHRGHGRLEALKILAGGPDAPPSHHDRFREEIQALGALDHPNIIPLYEAGEVDGTPYYSMKLVDGPSLAAELSKRSAPVPALEASQLIRTVARAVHHAHRRGVLHRDLKPSNILIENEATPQLIDFGVAKLEFSDLDLTESNTLLGTVPYMSPEQAAGDARRVTVASDVWSLGVILYEMLTLRMPFRGESREETLRRIRLDEPADVRSVNRELDRDIATICHRCLVKEPAGRYSTAEALAEDLERWLRREPIHARQVSGPERFLRWCRRKPALAALGGVTVVALMLGGASIANWRASRQLEAQGRFFRSVLDLNLANSSLDEGSLLRTHAFLDGDGRGAGAKDWPEIEWQLLKSEARDQERRILLSSNAPVLAVAASADETVFAAALPGQLVVRREGASAVSSWVAPWTTREQVALIVDGAGERVLAASAASVTSYSWKTGASGTVLATGGNRLAWSAETRRLAIGKMTESNLGRPGSLSILQEGETWETVGTIENLGTAALQWRSGGHELLIAARNGGVLVWNGESRTSTTSYLSRVGVFQAAFSPDGTRIARVEVGGRLILSDVDGAHRLEIIGRTFPEHATQLTYLADGARLVVAGGADQRLHVLDGATGVERFSLQGHRGNLLSLASMRSPNRLLSGARDGSMREWMVVDQGGRSLRIPHNVTSLEVQAPVFSPDGRWLAFADNFRSGRAETRIWSLESNVVRATVVGRPVRFAPDSSGLMAWNARRLGTYLLPQARWENYPAELPGPAPLEPQMSLDGRRIFFLNTNLLVSALEAPAWKLVAQCPQKTDWFQPTPDGRGAVVLGLNLDSGYWDLASGRVLNLATGSRYDAIAISSGSDLAAVGDWQGNIRVCALPSGRLLEEYLADAGGVTALAFANAGRTLLAGSQDGYIRFFNRAARRQSLSLRLGGPVGWIRFGPGEKMLLAGTLSAAGQTNGTYYVWRFAAE